MLEASTEHALRVRDEGSTVFSASRPQVLLVFPRSSLSTGSSSRSAFHLIWKERRLTRSGLPELAGTSRPDAGVWEGIELKDKSFFVMCDPSTFCQAHRDRLIQMRPFSAVLRRLPSFFAPSDETGRSSWLLCCAILLCCLPVLRNVQFGCLLHKSCSLCSSDVFSQLLQCSL